MEKIGLLKNDKMGEYEKEKGYASYRTLVNYFIGDCVLCNNIIDIDESVYDNIENGCYYRNRFTNEEATEEQYYEDKEDIIELEYKDIYQYFICDVGSYDKQQALKSGLVLSHSELLDCDILCVDHLGTSWDYVLSDVKLFDNYEDLKKWENEEEEEG